METKLPEHWWHEMQGPRSGVRLDIWACEDEAEDGGSMAQMPEWRGLWAAPSVPCGGRHHLLRGWVRQGRGTAR